MIITNNKVSEIKSKNIDIDYSPLLSIITVVYNSEAFIEKTIENVLTQLDDDIEYIIIDGNSSDNTINILKKYDDKITQWVSEDDEGIYDAMNKGIKLANGKWIGFINAGDYYEKHILTLIKNLIKTNNNIEIIHGSNTYIDNKNNIIHVHTPKDVECSVISHPSTFTTKDILIKYGLYRTDFKIASDLYFYLISAKNTNKLFIEENISYMLNDGVSSKFNIKVAKEFYLLYKACGYSKIKSFYKAYIRSGIKNCLLIFLNENTVNNIRKKLVSDYK